MRRILRGGEAPKTKVADLIRGLYFDTVNNYSVACAARARRSGRTTSCWGPTFPT